jgi:hypothetical protein
VRGPDDGSSSLTLDRRTATLESTGFSHTRCYALVSTITRLCAQTLTRTGRGMFCLLSLRKHETLDRAAAASMGESVAIEVREGQRKREKEKERKK